MTSPLSPTTEAEIQNRKQAKRSAMALWLLGSRNWSKARQTDHAVLLAGCCSSSPPLWPPNQPRVLGSFVTPPSARPAQPIPSEAAGSSCRPCQASVFLPSPWMADPSSNSAPLLSFLMAPASTPFLSSYQCPISQPLLSKRDTPSGLFRVLGTRTS